ncbi:AMP-dependent synthetase/ligase [Treponema pectinovorum]|uniref:AMP-dependent synthetase/ligase n=1 Tax=Treponema pectinovorum TaxID=164 RepID=UPI0011CB094D|nr:long-chain fatty acid--CoA ligase [Treponema pectinovorum]
MIEKIFPDTTFDKTLGKNLPVMLREKVKKIPNFTLQAVKNKSGVFVRYSYSQVYQHIIEMAYSLKKLGIKRGDHVGFISDNRREWLISDYALLCLGAVDVPRGCDSMGVEIRFILNFAECKYSFFENGRQLEKVLEKVEEVPLLKTAILFDYPEQELVEKAKACGIEVVNFHFLESSGVEISTEDWQKIEDEMETISGDDLATIIFTSGTTGLPKGVQLTHDNYMAQCEVAHHSLGLMQKGDIWLTVLPIWHSFERAFLYMVVALEGGFAYSKPIASIMLSDMAQIQPQWMNGVPRLWESVAQGLFREVKKQSGIKQWEFSTAVYIGKQFYKAKELVFGLRCRFKWYPRFLATIIGIIPYILLWLPNFAAENLVFKKIRSKFGGKMRAAISGGGALQPNTEAFFHAIGFKLMEGYGMTETAPVVSVCNSKKTRSNNVGLIFPSNEVKIVKEKNGEPVNSTPLKPGKRGLVMVKGRQVMKGYYKRQDLTDKVIDSEGWMNTGDLGMISYDKELKIVGRAKDTIVLLGGENIEPQGIEKAINISPYVERSVVVGQDQKFIGALICPDQANVINYAEENSILYDNYENLLETNEIQNLFRTEIDSCVNAKAGFRACERIFKFKLLTQSFQIGKEINMKQELMRHQIVEIYKKELKKMFAEK